MMTHRNRLTIFFLSALLAASGLVGCKEAPSAAAIEWQLERHFPGLDLKRESHVRIPRIAMSAIRKLMRLTGENQEDMRLISNVKRVNVATYRVLSRPDTEPLDVSPRFEERLAKNDWELMVRLREDDEQTWLFTRQGEEAGAITNLYVVALDPHELTVVDLAGRIDRILAEALADDPGELVEIFGP